VDHGFERANRDDARELGVGQPELSCVIDEIDGRARTALARFLSGLDGLFERQGTLRKCESPRCPRLPKLYPMQAPETLPHRPVQWRRALRALRGMRGNYDSRLIMEYASALEGDEGERGFQDFLGEPGAAELERERPCLAAALDDWERLATLPAQSLGGAYLALARRDQIRVGDLVAGAHALADERERAPDPLRRWYRDRMLAMHDLLHVVTGYDRDRAGELLLIGFTLGIWSLRALRISLALTPFSVPLRVLPGMARDVWRAWRRGRAARITRATRLEELLPLPIAEVQARLGVAPEPSAHPQGIWRESPRGRWRRGPIARAASDPGRSCPAARAGAPPRAAGTAARSACRSARRS